MLRMVLSDKYLRPLRSNSADHQEVSECSGFRGVFASSESNMTAMLGNELDSENPTV